MTRSRNPISRRRFVQQTLAAGATVFSTDALDRRLGLFSRAPGIVRQDAARPALAEGVSAGLAGVDRAVIWSRTDRPSRMFVEYATTEAFANVSRIQGPAAMESTDFTAKTVLTGLPAGQKVFYRVTFQDLADVRSVSEPIVGSFRTPDVKAGGRDLTLAWSADTVGQGWGINEAWGGLRLYETMLKAEPDVFINSGDTIYADQPLPPEIKLDDGSTWKNLVTPAKTKVAETLEEYRGNFRYNLLDAHMRRFNATVAQIPQWDDHEVRDNWYLERDLSKDDRFTLKSMALLSAHARQAFLEYHPIPVDPLDSERIYRTVSLGPQVEVFVLDLRSYRGANSPNVQPTLTEESAFAGAAQVEWLKSRLAESRATWKIIASDMPIGLTVPDAPGNFDAFANGDAGAPLGREIELAGLLKFIKDRRIHNIVWITADVHYCAAHYYHPSRAKFTEFEPFWEFVAGPLNAGTFGPSTLDPTFGPEVRFTGIPKGMKPNRPPSDGFQFFGLLRVDSRGRLTVTLNDLAGKKLFSQELHA